MGGIDVGRWVASGIVAAIVIWILEGVASVLYMDDMAAALEAHGLAMDVSAGIMVMSVIVSLIVGFTLMFIYVAARPRFGAGPGTAVIAAITLWLGGYVLSLLGYGMLGLYPTGMLVMWGVVGLVELVLAALAGGWVYRES